MIFNIPFKKFLIAVIVVIMLFTPTYFAIGSYNANKVDPSLSSELTELTVRDPDGNITIVTSENDPDGVMDMFKALMEDATRISSLPDSISGERFLLATYKSIGGESPSTSSYKYYFSTDSAACYFTNPNGESFKIEPTSAKRFLASSYSVYLYDNAAPPVLTAGEGNTIVPTNITWLYLASGGIYQEYKKTSTSETVLDYDVGSAMNFNFTVKPDDCNLKVYNGKVALYDGPYDKLPALPITRNTLLTFIIEANWKRTDNCQYYGEATYSFNANITAPADFKLGATAINHGEFVVLSGINVSDPSKIKFESSPAINFTPVFYTDATAKDTVHALIPIGYDVARSETFTFTVSYGVAQKTLTLNVKEPSYAFDERTYAATTALIDSCFTPELVANAKNTFNSICASSTATRYFSDAFLDFFGKPFSSKDGSLTGLKVGFGKRMTLENATERKYTNPGMEFAISAGKEIPAMQSGIVCAVGSNEVMGKYVVVDHGYGLKTWYTNLSETSVSVNDTIAKKQVIGKAGNTGFIIKGRSRIMFTVGNVPVSPYGLWSASINFPTFN